jgi:phosphatidylglycerol---prolipoprotein diacylglyceryl transferase
MLPVINVGPLAIQFPGLLLLAGVWLGLWLAEKNSLRLAQERARPGQPPSPSPDAVYSLAFVGLLAGLLGARLAYAARFLGAYLADPLALLSLSPATLAPVEGALIGVLAAWVYGVRRSLGLWPTLDALAPFAAVMAAAIAAANLASGDGYGAPTTVPWRIYLWDDFRHPSQMYELAAALGVLSIWLWWSRKYGPAAPPGRALVLVIVLLAAARVFLEAFRGDSMLLAGGLRLAQVVGLAIVAAGLVAWRALGRAPESAPEA